MIKSISIKNFKNIWKQELKLNDLTDVNYLVWVNNCGKSSILYAALSFDQSNQLTNFFKPDGNISYEIDWGRVFDVSLTQQQPEETNLITTWIFSLENLAKFPHDVFKESKIFPYVQCDDVSSSNGPFYKFFREKVGSISEHFSSWFNWSDLSIKNIWWEDLVPGIDKLFLKEDEIQLSSVADWLRQVVSFMRSLEKKFEYYGTKEGTNRRPNNIIFCIDEPETCLHPQLQKVVPFLLQTSVDKIKSFWIENVYLVVATHSPFIISAAADLVHQEKVRFKQVGWERKDFVPSQKVYKIKNWKCLNPDWSSGDAVVFESAKMLGMWLGDFILAPSIQTAVKSFIVFCEWWEKKDMPSDSEIYNEIFRSRHNVLFISCASCVDVYHQYIAAKEFYKYQIDQVKVIGLIDNDTKNKNKEDRISEGLRILSRSEIENYLYDIEVVNKLEWDRSKVIKILNDIDIVNYDVKNEPVLNQSLKSEQLDLSKLITPDTNVYKVLNKDIFG